MGSTVEAARETDGGAREVVLVTGFPGALARRVCTELASAEGPGPRAGAREVRILASSDKADAARSFAHAHESARCAMRVLEGDPTAIDLGLSGREFNELASALTHVQHHGLPTGERAHSREAAREVLASAREVLSLARAAPRIERVVFGSSVGALGDARGVVREEDLSLGQAFRDPLEEALYRAERLARRAMESLPITVTRASIVVGDSKTGEIDELDGPYLLVLLLFTSPVEIAVPLPARGTAPLNLVPLDFVARANVALMHADEAAGRTFHLVDPSPLPARRAYELIAQAAGRRMPRGFIPANVTRAILRTPGLERFLKSPRAFLEQLATEVAYQSVGTREVLQPMRVECPSLEQYVDVLVGYVRDRVAQRQRARSDGAGSQQFDAEDPLA